RHLLFRREANVVGPAEADRCGGHESHPENDAKNFSKIRHALGPCPRSKLAFPRKAGTAYPKRAVIEKRKCHPWLVIGDGWMVARSRKPSQPCGGLNRGAGLVISIHSVEEGGVPPISSTPVLPGDPLDERR